MKKLLAMVITGAMAIGVLAGCSSEDAASVVSNADVSAVEKELEKAASTIEAAIENAESSAEEATVVKAEGDTFTVGFDAEFPPYGYMDDNGEYVGFDLDLAEEVCARNGWVLEKRPIDWDSKDMELSSGTIDCIWSGFTIQGRENDYTWTVPYVDNSQVFVSKKSSEIATQADLTGKVVGVQKDSSALAALEGDSQALAATFADMIQYADYNTAFMDLETGAIDAVAMDIGVAAYQISSRGEEYVIMDEHLSAEQYGVGFMKGNDALKDQVEKTLLEMAADGKVAEIAQKYADFGMPDSVCLGK